MDFADVPLQFERAERALAALPESEHVLRFRLHCWLAWQLIYGSNPHEAKPHVDAVLVEAELTRHTGHLAAALQVEHAFLVAVQAHLDERIQVAERIRSLRREGSRAEGALIGGASLFEDLLELGQVTGLRSALADYRRHADRLVRPYEMWSARSIRVALALWEGDLGNVPTFISEAAAIGAEFRIDVAPRAVAVQQLLLAWELDELPRYITLLMSLASGKTQQSSWLAGLAVAYVTNDENDRARELISELIAQIASETQPSASVTLAVFGAEVAFALDERRLALAVLPTLQPLIGRFRIIPTAVGSFGPVDRYRALALATIGELDAAIDAVDDGRVLATVRHSPLWVARCAVDESRLLARRGQAGDRSRANELTLDAERLGQRHGSRLVPRVVAEVRASMT